MRSHISNAVLTLICFASLCSAKNCLADMLDMTTEKPEPKTIMLWSGERWMLDYINYYRKQHGLKEVIIDPKLQERCRKHCMWMAQTGSMVHSGAGGENIAAGQANVAEAMQAWRADGPHWVQIVNPNHRVVGVACYKAPNGQRFFCQQFSQ